MTDLLAITPIEHPVAGGIRPPGSKSITNRALVCAALAEGSSQLRGALDSDDTRVMVEALAQLGIAVKHDRTACTIDVDGCGGCIPAAAADLFVGNSGTTIRFLTAMLALGRGRYRLRGTQRMHERPIQDQITAMRQLGVLVECENRNGCPPVIVRSGGCFGGTATVRSDASSQFLSGLLMVAPYAAVPVTLATEGELVSQPYVTMTLEVMREFGVAVEAADLHRIVVPCGRYRGRTYEIEPDASAASYFFAAAAVTGGAVTVEGLSRHALQGDVGFVDVLASMGCAVEASPAGLTVRGPDFRRGERLRGVDVDMNAVSDTVQTLGVVALFADGPTTIRGVAHIRCKETDRIAAPAAELRKLGAAVEERPDGMRITPGTPHGATIDTYDDHRMAMSFSLAGLRIAGVKIRDPGCTSKTYPRYFDDFRRLTGAQTSREK